MTEPIITCSKGRTEGRTERPHRHAANGVTCGTRRSHSKIVTGVVTAHLLAIGDVGAAAQRGHGGGSGNRLVQPWPFG
jgi:hypothetical protein